MSGGLKGTKRNTTIFAGGYHLPRILLLAQLRDTCEAFGADGTAENRQAMVSAGIALETFDRERREARA